MRDHGRRSGSLRARRRGGGRRCSRGSRSRCRCDRCSWRGGRRSRWRRSGGVRGGLRLQRGWRGCIRRSRRRNRCGCGRRRGRCCSRRRGRLRGHGDWRWSRRRRRRGRRRGRTDGRGRMRNRRCRRVGRTRVQRLQARERGVHCRVVCRRRVRQRLQPCESAMRRGHVMCAREHFCHDRHAAASQLQQRLLVGSACVLRGDLGAGARDQLGHGRSRCPHATGHGRRVVSGRYRSAGAYRLSERCRLRRGLCFGFHDTCGTLRHLRRRETEPPRKYPARLSALSI